jgi:DNA-binding GntR family transcriptional regulator
MERTRPLIRNEHFTDVRAYARANAWFHETLVGLSGSQDLVDAYRRLSLPSVLVRALTSSSYASDALVEDHDRIVTALEQRDPDAAREAVRVHTKHTKEVHRRSLLQRS